MDKLKKLQEKRAVLITEMEEANEKEHLIYFNQKSLNYKS